MSRETYLWCADSSQQRICSQVQHHTDLTELNHLPYSSDIAFCYYHLFSNVKNYLRDWNCQSNNDRESLFEGF